MKSKKQVLAMMWALVAEIENGSSVSTMLIHKLKAYVAILDKKDISQDMRDTIDRLGLTYMLG